MTLDFETSAPSFEDLFPTEDPFGFFTTAPEPKKVKKKDRKKEKKKLKIKTTQTSKTTEISQIHDDNSHVNILDILGDSAPKTTQRPSTTRQSFAKNVLSLLSNFVRKPDLPTSPLITSTQAGTSEKTTKLAQTTSSPTFMTEIEKNTKDTILDTFETTTGEISPKVSTTIASLFTESEEEIALFENKDSLSSIGTPIRTTRAPTVDEWEEDGPKNQTENPVSEVEGNNAPTNDTTVFNTEELEFLTAYDPAPHNHSDLINATLTVINETTTGNLTFLFEHNENQVKQEPVYNCTGKTGTIPTNGSQTMTCENQEQLDYRNSLALSILFYEESSRKNEVSTG